MGVEKRSQHLGHVTKSLSYHGIVFGRLLAPVRARFFGIQPRGRGLGWGLGLAALFTEGGEVFFDL
jgi:hypothetical protein